MVLHAHFKKHIIALGGWLLMYTSGPPRPPVWQKTIFFPDFFCYLPLQRWEHYVQEDCQQTAQGDNKGFCHFMSNTYRDLIFDICYIATCFRFYEVQVIYVYLLCCRDDARISKLYKGLSCTEISVKTGNFCNPNRGFCVLPSTPGKLETACPSQAGRTIGRRKRRKRAKAKHGRKKGDRLVGATAHHTYSRSNPPFRYPWICSLRTQGFRWQPPQKNQISFHPQGSTPLFSYPSVCPSRANYPCGSGTLQLFVQGRVEHRGGVLL